MGGTRQRRQQLRFGAARSHRGNCHRAAHRLLGLGRRDLLGGDESGDRGTTSATWWEQVYLSASAIFDTQTATYLGAVQNAAYLAAGDSYTRSVDIRLADGISGTHYIHVWTDFFRRIRSPDHAELAHRQPWRRVHQRHIQRRRLHLHRRRPEHRHRLMRLGEWTHSGALAQHGLHADADRIFAQWHRR
ncbi:MAG: hypothetical protein R2856_24210 [Caldilineaceae bacterium]